MRSGSRCRRAISPPFSLADAAQRHRLRAACGVRRNGQIAGTRAGSRRRETQVDLTGGARVQLQTIVSAVVGGDAEIG